MASNPPSKYMSGKCVAKTSVVKAYFRGKLKDEFISDRFLFNVSFTY